MRLPGAILLTLATAVAGPAAVEAGQAAATATLNANLAPVAGLTLSTNSIVFPDADPDTTPQVPALPGPVSITAKARARMGSTVLLTVTASDDLRSGVTVLPASHITWTASGPGFVGGTLDRLAARTVATWSGSGIHAGSQNFLFRNLWSHPSGTYTVTVLYTLVAP
jgi:hypothetical protein